MVRNNWMAYNLRGANIMDTINIDKFHEWLRRNTSLAESSILLYVRTINRFLQNYKEINKDNINNFISERMRESNSTYIKFPFKIFLQFIGRPTLYYSLINLKRNPRKKFGKFIPKYRVEKIISNIKNQIHKDMATLQFYTASRFRGIATLTSENIDYDYSDDVVRLRLLDKGGKEHMKFLLKTKFLNIIKKYDKNDTYLFLPKDAQFCNNIELERLLNTCHRYYFKSIRKAANIEGIERFGTHDLRRNMADYLISKGISERDLKNFLGHRSIINTEKYFQDNPNAIIDVMINVQNE